MALCAFWGFTPGIPNIPFKTIWPSLSAPSNHNHWWLTQWQKGFGFSLAWDHSICSSPALFSPVVATPQSKNIQIGLNGNCKLCQGRNMMTSNPFCYDYWSLTHRTLDSADICHIVKLAFRHKADIHVYT